MIDQPILKERWLGGSGVPTMMGDIPCRTKATTEMQEAVLVTTTPQMFRGERVAVLEAFTHAVHVTSFGGDCYNYGMLASGYVDIVLEDRLKLHDWAALVPVVEGAGGIITDWNGKPITLKSKGDVLATANEALHTQALEIIKKALSK